MSDEFINRFKPEHPCDCLNSFLKREEKDVLWLTLKNQEMATSE